MPLWSPAITLSLHIIVNLVPSPKLNYCFKSFEDSKHLWLLLQEKQLTHSYTIIYNVKKCLFPLSVVTCTGPHTFECIWAYRLRWMACFPNHLSTEGFSVMVFNRTHILHKLFVLVSALVIQLPFLCPPTFVDSVSSSDQVFCATPNSQAMSSTAAVGAFKSQIHTPWFKSNRALRPC